MRAVSGWPSTRSVSSPDLSRNANTVESASAYAADDAQPASTVMNAMAAWW